MTIGMVVLDFEMQSGIERATVELSRDFARRGHQVTVFSSSFKTPLTSSMKHVSIPTWELTTSTKLLTFRFMSQSLLANAEFDVLHSQGPITGRFDVITMHSCHRAGMDIRKRNPRMFRTRRNLHIADSIRLTAERNALRRGKYKKIVAVSHGVKRELSEYYDLPEQDIEVIPNGVDLEEYSRATDERKAKRKVELGFKPDQVLLIFVANEFDRKGLDYLLQSLTLIKLDNVLLIVAGGDNPRPFVEYSHKLGVAQKVRFVGLQSSLASYYQASDIFVLPTYYEAFSLATLEAAASGLPLVVTKVNGTEELVREGMNGLFIERDADSIAQRLNLLLNDGVKRKELGDNARRTAESYSWKNIGEKTLKVYENVVRMKSS